MSFCRRPIAQTLESWQLTISENGPGGGVIAAIVEPSSSGARDRASISTAP
jgi:hypothetical protein